LQIPPPQCVTAASEDLDNRSRYERRSLRWVATTAETLCCCAARSVVEVTREVRVLSGKDKGKTSFEICYYVSSLELDESRAEKLLETIRLYWSIESGLHQRLDVTAGEDSSRVRNRNAITVLGILRRSTIGIYYQWKRRQKNQRKSTFKDFHDAMNKFNNRQAFAAVTTPKP
jgi:predicted transposase YbfD/YdcC